MHELLSNRSYLHNDPYILYTPYHTYRIRVLIRFFPNTQIRIQIQKM